VYTHKEMRFRAGVVVLLGACWPAQGSAQSSAETLASSDPPILRAAGDRLTYDVEWRLIHAGTVVIEAQKSGAQMRLVSEGMVSALIKIQDVYQVDWDDRFCASAATMDSQEGKRHRDTRITYDGAAGQATYLERDVVKNKTLQTHEVHIPDCVHEVVGAFLKLRGMSVPLGKSVQIPMSDGIKFAAVKVEAQEREDVKTPQGVFKTVRYEANMLNGVIYSRKGRVFVWLTDDGRRLPVQIRLRMNFPIGTVTLQLLKEEHP
jgi:hypothetical protein